MRILGINALNHDASVSIVDNGTVVHHEKSLCNFDLCPELLDRALKYGPIDYIAWYENSWIKKSRQLYAGQYKDAFDLTQLPSFYLKTFGINGIPIKYVPHHLSHAASAVYESKFKETLVIVADAIGEWDTVSIWSYRNNKFTKLYSKKYPYSLGLFYSSFTELLGYKPVSEESKVYELAKHGDWTKFYDRVLTYTRKNLHKGIWDWDVEEQDKVDIAAAVQRVFLDQLKIFFQMAAKEGKTCVFTGGCAFNKGSEHLIRYYFRNYYIPKNPGDYGSSIGAALYLLNTL